VLTPTTVICITVVVLVGACLCTNNLLWGISVWLPPRPVGLCKDVSKGYVVQSFGENKLFIVFLLFI
jgi:hypothetical protein